MISRRTGCSSVLVGHSLSHPPQKVIPPSEAFRLLLLGPCVGRNHRRICAHSGSFVRAELISKCRPTYFPVHKEYVPLLPESTNLLHPCSMLCYNRSYACQRDTDLLSGTGELAVFRIKFQHQTRPRLSCLRDSPLPARNLTSVPGP
jgi:hypothetical protein